jgi:predicted nucleic acid-binding protein
LPDLNVWLALSWANHMHSDAAWAWFSRQEDNRFFFCRFTQLGLLRLLATSAVMGKDVRTIGEGVRPVARGFASRNPAGGV